MCGRDGCEAPLVFGPAGIPLASRHGGDSEVDWRIRVASKHASVGVPRRIQSSVVDTPAGQLPTQGHPPIHSSALTRVRIGRLLPRCNLRFERHWARSNHFTEYLQQGRPMPKNVNDTDLDFDPDDAPDLSQGVWPDLLARASVSVGRPAVPKPTGPAKVTPVSTGSPRPVAQGIRSRQPSGSRVSVPDRPGSA